MANPFACDKRGVQFTRVSAASKLLIGRETIEASGGRLDG
jgi:hypothetical protein